jgi:hypothetical protein
MISSKHASMECLTPVLSLRGSTWLVSSVLQSTQLYSRTKDCLELRYLTKTELHKGHSFLRVMFPSQILRHVRKNVFFEVDDVEFLPDTKEQPSKDAGQPSRDARRVRTQAPEAPGLPSNEARRLQASEQPAQASQEAGASSRGRV